jgi:hypothetical protein
VFDVGGESYVAAMSELEESSQARPRIVVAQVLVPPSPTTRSMIFVPPVLVIIAVLFALMAGRRIVVRQP